VKPDIQMMREIYQRLNMTPEESQDFHYWIQQQYLGATGNMKFNELFRIAQDWLNNRRRIMSGGRR